MEVFKDSKKVVITANCTREEISDAIAILEALRKDMKPDKQFRNAKAKRVARFFAECQRKGVPTRMNIEF